MQQMAGEVRDKDERAKLLADELEKMPKNVNRNLYTYRIMDIINSISKQKQVDSFCVCVCICFRFAMLDARRKKSKQLSFLPMTGNRQDHRRRATGTERYQFYWREAPEGRSPGRRKNIYLRKSTEEGSSNGTIL